eukprot:scaffold23376_cov124-Isochrysis_galbana.AAC.9
MRAGDYVGDSEGRGGLRPSWPNLRSRLSPVPCSPRKLGRCARRRWLRPVCGPAWPCWWPLPHRRRARQPWRPRSPAHLTRYQRQAPLCPRSTSCSVGWPCGSFPCG